LGWLLLLTDIYNRATTDRTTESQSAQRLLKRKSRQPPAWRSLPGSRSWPLARGPGRRCLQGGQEAGRTRDHGFTWRREAAKSRWEKDRFCHVRIDFRLNRWRT